MQRMRYPERIGRAPKPLRIGPPVQAEAEGDVPASSRRNTIADRLGEAAVASLRAAVRGRRRRA